MVAEGVFFRVGFWARVVDFFVDGSQQTCFLARKHVPIPYSRSSNRFCCVCVSRLVFEVCSLASSGGPNNPQNCRPLLVVWLKVVLTPRAHTSTSLLSLVFIFRVVSLIFLWERCLPRVHSDCAQMPRVNAAIPPKVKELRVGRIQGGCSSIKEAARTR